MPACRGYEAKREDRFATNRLVRAASRWRVTSTPATFQGLSATALATKRLGTLKMEFAIFGANIRGRQQVVGVGKSTGILAVVERMRPGVIGHDLEVICHAAVEIG